jgi:hypothetical protein
MDNRLAMVALVLGTGLFVFGFVDRSNPLSRETMAPVGQTITMAVGAMMAVAGVCGFSLRRR